MKGSDQRGGVFSAFVACAKHAEDRAALIGHTQPTTYGQLHARATELAARLPTSSEASPRVGLLLHNGRDFIAGFLAVAARGGLAVPLNPRMTAADLGWYARQLGFEALFTTRTLGRPLLDGLPALADRSVYVEEIPAGSRAGADRLRPGDFDNDTPAVCLSTSGTTGTPKLVVRSHASLLANARAIATDLAIGETDRFAAVVPFCHAYGLGASMLVPLLAGASLAPQMQFAPKGLTGLCREFNLTVLPGSPMIFSMLADSDASPEDFAAVRHCLSSGARLAPDIARRCCDRLGLRVRQLYGSSEMGTVAIGGGDEEADTDCVGTPLPGIGLRIAPAKPADDGACGEVLVRSPAIMSGYLEAGGLEPAPLSDGYYPTGDLGSLTAAGALRLAGRRKRMINVCGINVDPVEIEVVLNTMPGVHEARASSRVNDRGMETIAVAIRAEKGIKLGRAEVIRFCRGRLAEYKMPRVIDFVETFTLKEG